MTPAEREERHRAQIDRWRAANMEHVRQYDRERRARMTAEEREKVREYHREYQRKVRLGLIVPKHRSAKLSSDALSRRAENRRLWLEAHPGGKHTHPEGPLRAGETHYTPDGWEETARHCAQCGKLAWMNDMRPDICPECYIKNNIRELDEYIANKINSLGGYK